MSITKFSYFNADGVVRGHFVYALTCLESKSKFFFVAVGLTVSPLERLKNLRGKCPLPQHEVALIHHPSRQQADLISLAIHHALRNWKHSGIWYRIDIGRRLEYDLRLLDVKAKFERRENPFHIQIINIRELRKFYREKRDVAARRWLNGFA